MKNEAMKKCVLESAKIHDTNVASHLLSKEYTFKNVNKTFTLKTPMSGNSFNVKYVVICSGCLEESIRETGAGKAKLRLGVNQRREMTYNVIFPITFNIPLVSALLW